MANGDVAQPPQPPPGGVFYYCDACGNRIPPSDWRGGQAQMVDENKALCAACAAKRGGLAAPLPPPPVHSRPPTPARPFPRPTSTPQVMPPNASAPATTSHSAMRAVSSESGARPSRGTAVKVAQKPKGFDWRIAAGAGGAVILIVIGAFFMRSGKPTAASTPSESASKDPAPPTQPPTPPTKTEPNSNRRLEPTPQKPEPKKEEVDDYDPRKAVSDSLLAGTLDYQKKNPDDVYGIREKLEQLRDRYNGTAAADRAVKLLEELKLPPVDPETNPAPPTDGAWPGAVTLIPGEIQDPEKLKGGWSVANGAFRSDKGMWTKLALPYILPETYDLRLTFSRLDAEDCVLVVLSRRGKPFILSLGSRNSAAAFEEIREKKKDVFPTKLTRHGILANWQRYTLTIQVRSQCLRAYLNGKPLVGCQVDDDGISLKPELTMPQPNQLGLMTWGSVYEFQKLEVLPVTGEGKKLR